MDWHCPECGQRNDEELIRCGCGYEIDEEEKNYALGKYDDIGSQKSEPNLNDDTMPNVVPRLFFRRIAAFIIDTVLLGILGQVLSIGLTSQLILLGDKGPFIGLFVLSIYFGLGNSRVFNGQTVGKFLMKISLKRLDGEKLPISLSLQQCVRHESHKRFSRNCRS